MNDREKLKEVLDSLYQYLRNLDISSDPGPEVILATDMEEIIDDIECYLLCETDLEEKKT